MPNKKVTDLLTYNFENIIFSEIKTETVPGSKMTFKRINVSTKLSDGSIGQLIFKTPCKNHTCFGIKEFVNEDGKVTGRSMGICMWDKDDPKDIQRKWTQKFDDMIEYIMDYIIKKKFDLGCPKLTKELLYNGGKFSPLFWSEDDKGIRIPNKGPVFNAKIWGGKEDNIYTLFDQVVGEKKNKRVTERIKNPLAVLTNKICNVEAAFIFDSIYFGSHKKPQFKAYQVVAEINERGPQNILEDEESSEDEGIFEGIIEKTEEKKEEDIEDSDEEEEPPQKNKKRIVRRKK